MGIHNENLILSAAISTWPKRYDWFNMQQLSNTVSTIIEEQLSVVQNPKVVLMHSSQ